MRVEGTVTVISNAKWIGRERVCVCDRSGDSGLDTRATVLNDDE